MKKRAGIVMLLAMVVGGIGWSLWRSREARNGDTIRVSGNIEITDVQVSFKVPGRVSRRLVQEGESVTNGQIVALLESAELSGLAEQAEAALAVARAEAERAGVEFDRQEELFRKKVVSEREYDLAKAARAIADARVKDAGAGLALARTRLGYATLTSPLSGVVLAQSVENGETVVPGTPVVVVGDLQNVWLRAYIAETDLGRVKLGQSVRIATDAYPGKVYEGRVSLIAQQAEFTPKNVQTVKERVKLVYRIKVDIPNAGMELKPGMPADAEIVTAQGERQ